LKDKVTIGILGLQGDIEENMTATKDALEHMKVRGTVKAVRYSEEFEKIDGLILPGGESTVMSNLIAIQGGALQTIRRRISNGMPTMGTCAGMIMLSKRAYDRIVGETKQQLMHNLDIVVERNAFGRQNDSFEAILEIPILGSGTFRGIFIRSPIVREVGTGVDQIAKFENNVVAVKQKNIIGTAFHPELAGDDRLHRQFIKMVIEFKKKCGQQ
jgi:5'-phosphate synthase pdxT subunit